MQLRISTLSIVSVVLLWFVFCALILSPQLAHAAQNDTSLSFNSSGSEFVAAPDSPSLGITGDISVEAWIKPVSGTNSMTIAAKKMVGSVNNGGYFFVLENVGQTGVLRLHFRVARANPFEYTYTYGTTDFNSLTSSKIGVWTHVAATWKAGTDTRPHIYVDGVDDGAFYTEQLLPSGTFAATHTDTTIGSGNGEDYFNGFMDNIRIWNVVRTPKEIVHGMSHSISKNKAGLVSSWDFNGTNLSDGTSNGNDLVNYGTSFSTDVP